MATQEEPKRKRPAGEPDEETRAAPEKARAESKAAVVRAKEERRARPKAEEALAEAGPAAEQAQAEQDRRALARAEQARTEAARPSMQTRRATEAQTENMELSRMEQEKAGAEQRVSFAVSLTVDARGQILRTHVEHAKSRNYDDFPALDVQRLAAFMKACISLPAAQQPPAVQPEPSPARAGAPTPEIRGPAACLSVSDVRVFREETPGIMALMLSPNEACVIEARFQLQGPEAAALTTRDPAFEIKVYATAVTGGTRGLLTTYNANVVKDVVDYTARMPAPSLSPGLYRLITLVTLREPIKMVGYYEGPIVEVAGVQPSSGLGAPPQVASPW